MSNKREKIKFMSEKDEDNVNKDFMRICFLFTGMSYFFCILKYEKYYDNIMISETQKSDTLLYRYEWH